MGPDSPSSSPASAQENKPDASDDTSQQPPPGTLYKLVMTPVNFVTFLFSLLLVDLRYSLARSHSHAEAPTRLPAWLQFLLYRPQPYQYGRVREQGPRDGRWFYHSKQKKLMKMEAEEAFKIRHAVLALLAVLLAAASGAAWYLATRLYHHYLPGARAA